MAKLKSKGPKPHSFRNKPLLNQWLRHLFQPLFHVRRGGGEITIQPVVLNESEYQFVVDLKTWCEEQAAALEKDGTELFLLRNMSRGKGVGFFEAGRLRPQQHRRWLRTCATNLLFLAKMLSSPAFSGKIST